jgi:hypothetical protein
MAASGQDGTITQVSEFLDSSSIQSSIATKVGDQVPNTSQLLTDCINCEFDNGNDDFVRVFTSQTVSSHYTDNDDHTLQDKNEYLDLSNDVVLNQTDIQDLDARLQNLPKDLYIEKLLELCSHNENMISWYRNTLCARARTQNSCPKGNLINRKGTKNSSIAQKYAKDCHTLYMFTQGDTSGIAYVFDKQKTNDTDVTKINTVELRVAVQSLQQRMNELEDTIKSKDKTISDLIPGLKTLQSQHEQLARNYEQLKAESTSKFTKYDSFQKLANTNFKRSEDDQIDFQNFKTKTTDDIKRLSKVTQNIQRHVNSQTPSKTYAKALSKPDEMNETKHSRSDEGKTTDKSSLKSSDEQIIEGIESIRNNITEKLCTIPDDTNHNEVNVSLETDTPLRSPHYNGSSDSRLMCSTRRHALKTMIAELPDAWNIRTIPV